MDERTAASALETASKTRLHVASLIVHVRPDRLEDVRQWLVGKHGVEVPVSAPEGKLVVVSESDSERAIADLMRDIGDREGVLNTAMIYHEIIDEKDDSP